MVALAPRLSVAVWGLARTIAGTVVVAVLCFGYGLRIAVGDDNPFDYFGYFTNQTSLLAAVILIATGSLMIVGRKVPRVLTTDGTDDPDGGR